MTGKNAGGNCTRPIYMLNLQYHLSLHSPANRDLQTAVSAPKFERHVNNPVYNVKISSMT